MIKKFSRRRELWNRGWSTHEEVQRGDLVEDRVGANKIYMDRKPIRGSLIVLEGGDGSGKGTQVGRLMERLSSLDIPVAIFDFPRYDTFYGQEVGRLMNGGYGPLNQVHPFLAAMLYAGDRLDAAPTMKEDLKAGYVVLCNRYVASNLAHGAAKFTDMVQALNFISKVEYMEYGVNNLSRPDLQMFLDVTVLQAKEMLATKGEREYMGGKGVDQAESDLTHQEKAVMMYRWLCENRPGFVRIECERLGDSEKEKEVRHELIWAEINKHFVV